jgi:hypothetical protein
MLSHKGQVIFYGPPGTGKTFIAQVDTIFSIKKNSIFFFFLRNYVNLLWELVGIEWGLLLLFNFTPHMLTRIL